MEKKKKKRKMQISFGKTTVFPKDKSKSFLGKVKVFWEIQKRKRLGWVEGLRQIVRMWTCGGNALRWGLSKRS